MADVSASSFASLVLGLITNPISIIAFLYTITNILPRKMIKDLEKLLKETRGDCITTLEEGLFYGENNQEIYLQRLERQEEDVSILVVRTYKANTLYKQFCELFGGLSWQIWRKYGEVRDLRDSITLSREEGRLLSASMDLSPLTLPVQQLRAFSPPSRSSRALPAQQLSDLLSSPNDRRSIALPYSPQFALQSLALPQTPPECHIFLKA